MLQDFEGLKTKTLFTEVKKKTKKNIMKKS